MKNIMDFWSTVRGVHLAEILMHELPKLTELLQNADRKQYTERIHKDTLCVFLEEEIRKGAKYVTHTEVDNDYILVIMEK